MKFLLTFFSLLISSYGSFSQSLEGEWKGSFKYYERIKGDPLGYVSLVDETPFRLKFILNSDSSYMVYSYTPWPNPDSRDTIVNAVLFKKLTNDSIYLQEIRTIKPENDKSDCWQVMRLKLIKRKRTDALEGTWTSLGRCELAGEMILSRKKK